MACEKIKFVSNPLIEEREIIDFVEEYIELGSNFLLHKENYRVSWKDDNGIPKESTVNRQRKIVKSNIAALYIFDEENDKSFRISIWGAGDVCIAIAFSTREEAENLHKKIDNWLFNGDIYID